MLEVLMVADVYIGLMVPPTLPLVIQKILLMVIGEVDTGTRPVTIPPVTQVNIVDCCLYLLVLIVLMIVFITM